MSNRLVFGAAALTAIALTGLPVPQAQAAPTGSFVPISSYDDDPFPADSVVERLGRSLFAVEEGGQRLLSGPLVAIEEESVVYREDPTTSNFIPFALNPWWPHARISNAAGDFRFPDEERFPLHRVERDANGKVVLVDGLQHWLPQDLHRGMTTVFEATHASLDAAQLWSGRRVALGNGGRLEINSHAFIDFNAFYSPTARMLFFGVVPHRLPGEPSSAPVKMFETATSWEIASHEAGHAIHAELKPNRVLTDLGYRTWGESFGDQMAMWVSLRDSGRGLALVAETNGVLDRSNSLTRMGEAFAALVGEGTGLRDAFHDKKVSDTSTEIHDRSEVLTGALYDFFLGIYGGLRRDHGPAGALKRAGRILGTFLVRAADFTPENRMTLEDVAKAYLKVDRELYDGRYHAVLVDEFIRRELFDAGSLGEWLDHEAATPQLWLRPQAADREVEQWLQAHLDALGVAPEFGLSLQSVTRSHLLRPDSGSEHTLVRVQLTLGRGEGATPFENHGILVFRPNGTLADYHAPLPPADTAARSSAASAQAEARATIAEAHARGLGQRGAPLSIVREPDGRLTAEVSVVRGEGLGAYMEVFTLDNPSGERREIPIPPVPPDRRIPIPDGLLE